MKRRLSLAIRREDIKPCRYKESYHGVIAILNSVVHQCTPSPISLVHNS